MRLLHLFILKEINYPLLLRIWKKFKSMENHSPAAVGAGGYWNQVFWEVLCDSDSPVLPLHYLEVFKLQLVFACLNHVMSKSPLILQHLPQTTAHNGGKKRGPGRRLGLQNARLASLRTGGSSPKPTFRNRIPVYWDKCRTPPWGDRDRWILGLGGQPA